jgi:hypothetical protein
MDSAVIPLRVLDRAMAQIKKTFVDQKTLTELQRASMADCIKETNSTANAIRLFESRNPGYQISRSTWDRMHQTAVPKHKTGRPPILTEAEVQDILCWIERFRNGGVAVSTATACAIAHGVVSRSREALLKSGAILLVPRTVARELARRNMRLRAATTSRTVSAAEIKRGGAGFFAELAATDVAHRSLVFNMDEFFVTLGENGRTTWTSVRSLGSVVIKAERAGFTSSVLTSMDGKVHLVQMIWKGKTNQVHANVGSPILLQQHREKTHFQDATTFEEWFQRFIQIVTGLRGRLGEDAKAALIIDAAPQHAGIEQLAADNNIVLIQVPKKQTHVFQPADQFVIANIRKRIKSERNNWIEDLVRNCGAQTKEAAEALLCKAHVLRDRKAKFLLNATASASRRQLGHYRHSACHVRRRAAARSPLRRVRLLPG